MLIRFSSREKPVFLPLPRPASGASATPGRPLKRSCAPPRDRPARVISRVALFDFLGAALHARPPTSPSPARLGTLEHISDRKGGEGIVCRPSRSAGSGSGRARVAARGRPRANNALQNQHDGYQPAPTAIRAASSGRATGTRGHERPRRKHHERRHQARRPHYEEIDGEHRPASKQDRQVVGLAHRPSDRQSEVRGRPPQPAGSSRIGRRSASTIARATTRNSARNAQEPKTAWSPIGGLRERRVAGPMSSPGARIPSGGRHAARAGTRAFVSRLLGAAGGGPRDRGQPGRREGPRKKRRRRRKRTPRPRGFTPSEPRRSRSAQARVVRLKAPRPAPRAGSSPAPSSRGLQQENARRVLPDARIRPTRAQPVRRGPAVADAVARPDVKKHRLAEGASPNRPEPRREEGELRSIRTVVEVEKIIRISAVRPLQGRLAPALICRSSRRKPPVLLRRSRA